MVFSIGFLTIPVIFLVLVGIGLYAMFNSKK